MAAAATTPVMRDSTAGIGLPGPGRPPGPTHVHSRLGVRRRFGSPARLAPPSSGRFPRHAAGCCAPQDAGCVPPGLAPVLPDQGAPRKREGASVRNITGDLVRSAQLFRAVPRRSPAPGTHAGRPAWCADRPAGSCGQQPRAVGQLPRPFPWFQTVQNALSWSKRLQWLKGLLTRSDRPILLAVARARCALNW